MYQCKSFKKYKGIRKPKCNDGQGCDRCNDLWNSKHLSRGAYSMQPMVLSPEEFEAFPCDLKKHLLDSIAEIKKESQ